MPVTKSAKKALKVSIRRASENARVRRAYKAAVKKVATASKNKQGEAVKQAQSVLDKAVKNNVIHARKAARLKSRLLKPQA